MRRSKRISPRTFWRSVSSSWRDAEKASWGCASRGVCCRIGKADGAAMIDDGIKPARRLCS